MSEEIVKVDIEKIMDEIRAEIAEKGYAAEDVDFESVSGREEMSRMFPYDVYDESIFEQSVRSVEMLAEVPWYQVPEGSKLACFLKRIICHFTRFMVIPLNESQNIFNDQVAKSFNQVLALAKEQEQTIEGLKLRIEELEKKIACPEEEKQE